jgi:mannosyltransferase OCH1-like enzyme
MFPELLYLLWDHDDMECFFKTLYPELMDVYLKLTVIMRADLFRYLVMHRLGGIYADIDTTPLKDFRFWFRSLDTWKNSKYTPNKSWSIPSEFLNVSFIVGVEVDVPKAIEGTGYWTYALQLCQWTFAAAPKSSVIWNVISKIIETARSKSQSELKYANVIDITGPDVWTREIYRFWRELGVDPNELREFGDSPRIINDQLILPLTAFSPGMSWDRGIGTMGSKNLSHPNSLVQHHFMGSWRGH